MCIRDRLISERETCELDNFLDFTKKLRDIRIIHICTRQINIDERFSINLSNFVIFTQNTKCYRYL